VPDKPVRGPRFLRVLGRLKPGITAAQAQSDLDSIAREVERERPDEDTGLGIRLVPLHEQLAGDLRPALRLAFIAAGIVLLVACINVSGLLLAASAGRAHETAVRAALGAGRARLAGQALLDSLLLAFAGGALGAAFAIPGTRVLLTLSPKLIPRGDEVSLDLPVLATGLGACLLAALTSGVAPALRAAHRPPSAVLRSAAPSVGGGGGRALAVLLVLEIALALPLLAGAGLLAKSLKRVSEVPLGFQADHVLTLRVELPAARYPKPEDLRAFHERLLERLAALPGARTAGLTSSLPLSGLYDITRDVTVERPSRGPVTLSAGYRAVSPGYFKALSIPLRTGRLFDGRDRDGSPPVVLVNEALARTAWPGESPLGKTVTFGGATGPIARAVVGVVGDIRHESPAVEPRPEVYVPLEQNPSRFASLVLATDSDSAALAPPVRAALRELDPDLGAAAVQPLDALRAAALAGPRFWLTLAALLGSAALLLVALGVYALAADAVARRTREIGVRMALGADRGQILRLVLLRSLALALLGLAIGLAAAVPFTRLLATLLYQVEANDQAVLVGASLFLLAITTAATWPAARRAAGVEVVEALRG